MNRIPPLAAPAPGGLAECARAWQVNECGCPSGDRTRALVTKILQPGQMFPFYFPDLARLRQRTGSSSDRKGVLPRGATMEKRAIPVEASGQGDIGINLESMIRKALA